METVTLKQINENILNLRKEVEHIKMIVEEDFELADDVVKEIGESRKRPEKEFISHEEMKKEFG